jgi:exosortase/archaeosortase family protein
MTLSEAIHGTKASIGQGLSWPVLLIGSFFAAYAPTILGLINGPWQTEQEGHGPLIIAASLWLIWQSREQIKSVAIQPAPLVGWTILVCGLLFMFLARTQDVLTFEALSALPVIVGCVLLTAGWPLLRIVAFPIGFLVFAVPAPDWAIDALTVPLKVLVSDLVTKMLYAAGYPSVLLLAAIIPITILANFIRVVTLVLIAYYGGVDLLEGPAHELTGIGLFVVAVTLLFLLDGFLGLGMRLINLLRGLRASSTSAPGTGRLLRRIR